MSASVEISKGEKGKDKRKKKDQKKKKKKKKKKEEEKKGSKGSRSNKGGKTVDFVELARVEAERAGFRVHKTVDVYDLMPHVGSEVADETALPFLSIDNDDTMDIDQLSCARQVADGIEIHVAIADVASYVHPGSTTDQKAAQNTTTLYLYVKNFWMIPERLCTDETSLAPGERRLSVITRFIVSPKGKLLQPKIWRAFVINKYKLAYNGVSAWLEGKGPLDVPQDIKEQIRLHVTASQWLGAHRRAKGSLPFRTAKAEPIIGKDKQPIGVKPVAPNNVAQDIIQYLMIATNHLCVKFLLQHKVPALRRIVKVPRQWPRLVDLAKQYGYALSAEVNVKDLQRFLEEQGRALEPEKYKDLSMLVIRLMGRGEYSVDDDEEGHFALATLNYTHSTAPNRRYPDLINQRMIIATLSGAKVPYSKEELVVIANQCSKMEDASNKLERVVSKMLIAQVMKKELGHKFFASICGLRKDKQQMWARIIKGDYAGVEGRLVNEFDDSLKMGDEIQVKLVSVQPKQGFIDFNLATE